MAVDYLVRGYVAGLPFLKVLGAGERVGSPDARLYTYTIYVERGIDYNKWRFGQLIDEILADKRGWIRGGKVAFQRVNNRANTQVVLALPNTVDALCAPLQTNGEVSCCQGSRVVINFERWMHAVEHWPLPLSMYRQMLVNHEMGHRIGKGHSHCPGPAKLAPVMQQQTYGLQGCRANPWPLPDEL